jgi:hypothetical protein
LAFQTKSDGNDEQTFALCTEDIAKNTLIRFEILNVSSWVGVGFAHKNKVL